MWKGLLRTLLVALSLAACSSGGGNGDSTDITLQHDNYPGGTIGFEDNTGTGDAVAAVFAPRIVRYQVRNVTFLFGSGTDSSAKTITLTLYADTGTAAPGAILYSGDFEVTPSAGTFQEIDLVAESIHVEVDVALRVAITLGHDGLPGIAFDGALVPDRNLVYVAGGNWFYKEDTILGGGDWVIRAQIRPEE